MVEKICVKMRLSWTILSCSRGVFFLLFRLKYIKFRHVVCCKCRNNSRDNHLSIYSHTNYFHSPKKVFQAKCFFRVGECVCVCLFFFGGGGCFRGMKNKVYLGEVTLSCFSLQSSKMMNSDRNVQTRDYFKVFRFENTNCIKFFVD